MRIYKCDNSPNGKFVKIYLKIREYFKYSNKNKELLIGKAPAMTSVQIEDFSTNYAPSIGFRYGKHFITRMGLFITS
jgi:hypothetical protein